MEYADKGDLYEKIAEHKKLGKRKDIYFKCSTRNWRVDHELFCDDGSCSKTHSW